MLFNMGNRRIYLGREVSKYAEIAGGAIITVTSLFFVLMVMGFTITGSDDICLGTADDPCVSYGKICNTGPDNYDIYNPDELKLDFSPTVKNYWMFFKDGRVKKQFLYDVGVNHSTSGWRYENFTDATKPRSDRVYVHRFARYSCQDYMLVGLKENPDDLIKWGFGVGAEYLDPFWYGENDSVADISVSNNITMELGSRINISTNLTGATTVCVDIDHPDYGDNYTCGSSNANFTFNISYFREDEFSDGTTVQELNSTYTLFNGTTYDGGSYGTSTPKEWCAEYSLDIPTSFLEIKYDLWSWVNGSDYYGDIVYPQIVIRDSDREIIETIIDTDFNQSVYEIRSVTSSDLYDSGLYGFCIKMPFVKKFPPTNDTELTIPYSSSIYALYHTVDMNYNYYANYSTSTIKLFFTPDNSFKHKFVYKDATSAWVQKDDLGTGTYIFENPNTSKTLDYIEVWAWSRNGGPGVDTILYNSSIWHIIPEACTNGTQTSNCNGGEFSARNSVGTAYTITGSTLNKPPYMRTYAQNNTFFEVASHRYDEVVGLSINLTAIETAENVKVFVNGTQTNYYPFIYNTTSATITETEETEFTLVIGNSTTFSIPKASVVTNTTMNFTGGNLTWEISENIIPMNAYGVLGSPSFGTPSWSPLSSDAWDGDIHSGTGLWLTPLYNIVYTGNIYENYTKVNPLLANWTAYYNSYPDAPFIQYCWGGSWVEIINDATSYVSTKISTVQIPSSCLSQSILQFKTLLEYDGTSGKLHRSYYREGKVNYYRYGYPENLTIEVGIVDDIQEYEGYGELTGSNSTTTFVDAINTFLATCTADENGYCEVPIYFNSQDGGSLTLDNFSVTYTSDPNPITISSSVISNYLNSSSVGYVDIPITISMESGSLNVSDLRYDYAGGNDTIEVFAYEQGNESNNETLNLINYFTDWDYSLPKFIDWLEFIPRLWNSKNVTPYGQTGGTPILNVSFQNYGNMNANYSIYLNETDSCVNLTISATNNKSEGTQLTNGTWVDILTDKPYLNSSGIWMWTDYYCNQSYWSYWSPDIYFKSCGVDVDVCSTDLI